MPMLADLDDPPRSRAGGLLLGLVMGIPLVAVVVGWLVPVLIGAIVGGARVLDARLRAQDTYMQELCSSAFDPVRDEALCGCVLAVEYPALDCQEPYRAWALERATEQCADAGAHAAALSYCTCIETVVADVRDAGDEDEQRRTAQAYDRCAELVDASPLPTVSQLLSPSR